MCIILPEGKQNIHYLRGLSNPQHFAQECTHLDNQVQEIVSQGGIIFSKCNGRMGDFCNDLLCNESTRFFSSRSTE